MLLYKIVFILWIVSVIFVFFKEDEYITDRLINTVAFAFFSAFFFAIVAFVGVILFGPTL